MTGIIGKGQLVTIAPILPEDSLEKGDVVLCKVNGAEHLHVIKAIRAGDYQIGNNHGGINGWAKRDNLFGRLVSVAD